MLEYRLSPEDDELDDYDEGAELSLDEELGDYGLDDDEDDAGPLVKAISYGWQAAERARLHSAFHEALTRYDDTLRLVDRLELQVGRDLQFIRINGTLVGGLIGLLLELLRQLVFST